MLSRGGIGRRIVATVMGADPVGVWLEVLLVARLIFNQEDTFESCQQYKCQDDEFKNCMNMQGANPCRDLIVSSNYRLKKPLTLNRVGGLFFYVYNASINRLISRMLVLLSRPKKSSFWCKLTTSSSWYSTHSLLDAYTSVHALFSSLS